MRKNMVNFSTARARGMEIGEAGEGVEFAI